MSIVVPDAFTNYFIASVGASAAHVASASQGHEQPESVARVSHTRGADTEAGHLK
jgi:hypothetical protein